MAVVTLCNLHFVLLHNTTTPSVSDTLSSVLSIVGNIYSSSHALPSLSLCPHHAHRHHTHIYTHHRVALHIVKDY